MDEEDDFSDIDIVDELETTIQPRRSNFLSVLCILTWIWSGVTLLLVFYAFVAGQQSVALMAKNLTNEWVLLTLLAPALCSGGAILMWNLNRLGFVLYLIGQLAPVIFSFYVAMGVKDIRGASLIFTILSNIIPIGFIVLYALNVPGMKKWGSGNSERKGF